MIVLANTSSFLYVVSSVVGPVDTYVVYADWNGQTVTLGRGATHQTDTTTGPWILGSPAAGVQRSVKYIGIRLTYTGTYYVSTVHYDGTTWAVLFNGTGANGGGYYYVEGRGWQFLTTSCALRRAFTA
jgi:hypothetical protein